MTPSRATEPPASVFTTVGAYTLLQSYASPFSVAQPAHDGQRLAAHDPLAITAQSQHQQASTASTASIPEPNSTAQQQPPQPSVVHSTHGQHPAAHDSNTAATANLAATTANIAAQVPAQSQHWQVSGIATVGSHSTFQPYAMAPTVTVLACGQLKVVHLAQADRSFLEQLQAAADKPPFSTNTSLRNEWCITPEVSNGSFM